MVIETLLCAQTNIPAPRPPRGTLVLVGILEAWHELLGVVGVGLELELEEPTFTRFVSQAQGAQGSPGWITRTLDFGAAGYDPVKYSEWQCATSVYSTTGRRPSDHKPVDIRFRQRVRPTRKKEGHKK